MVDTKQEAKQTIDALPDQVEWQDIVEALCLRFTIEDRVRDLDNGIFLEHEEVERRLLGQ